MNMYFLTSRWCYCVKGSWCCFPIQLLIFIYYYNGVVNMQICAPLTRSQCEVSDTPVTVRPVGLLLQEMLIWSFYIIYLNLFKFISLLNFCQTYFVHIKPTFNYGLLPGCPIPPIIIVVCIISSILKQCWSLGVCELAHFFFHRSNAHVQ